MELVDIRIGGITFKSSLEWIFHPTENFILARHDSQRGILKIAIAETAIGTNGDAASLRKEAETLISSDQPLAAFDLTDERVGETLFGTATYHVYKDTHQYLTRLWYIVHDNNMVIATYGCPWEQRNHPEVQNEIQQCHQMMHTVKFTGSSQEVESGEA